MQTVAVGDPQLVKVRFPASVTGVTVTITHDAGTIVTDASTTNEGNGVWSYQLLAAHVAEVDRLRANFVGLDGTIERAKVVWVEVAGAHYFDVEDVRDLPDIGASFTDAKIAEVRQAVESQVEENVGTTLVERYRKVTLNGNDAVHGIYLRLPAPFVQRVLAVYNDDGTLVDPANYTLDGRFLIGTWTVGHQNIEVRYVEGWSHEPPADIRDAALTHARSKLLAGTGTGVTNRASALTTEVGTLSLSIAGLRAPTGIPEVDAVLLHWANELHEVI